MKAESKCIRSLVTIAFTVATGLLCCSCATGPTKRYVRTSPSYTIVIPDVKTVGIINDVCIARGRVDKKGYYSVQDSRIAESHMLASAKTHLEGKGYQVEFDLAPFVGAFKLFDFPTCEVITGRTFRASTQQEDGVEDTRPPFFVSPSLGNDEVFRDALLDVIIRTTHAIALFNIPPEKTFSSSGNIRESLDVIAERTDVQHLLVMIANGRMTSMGESLKQALPQAIGVAILTGGMVSGAVYDVSYIDGYIGLIDLKSGEIVWSNHMRLKTGPNSVIQEKFFREQWVPQLLHHIPAKAKPQNAEQDESTVPSKAAPSASSTVR